MAEPPPVLVYLLRDRPNGQHDAFCPFVRLSVPVCLPVFKGAYRAT